MTTKRGKTNTRFMLITVVKREIFTEIFPTEEAAREKMLEEMKQCDNWENWEELYEISTDKKGFCDCGDFGVGPYGAWANDRNGRNFDWQIVEI